MILFLNDLTSFPRISKIDMKRPNYKVSCISKTSEEPRDRISSTQWKQQKLNKVQHISYAIGDLIIVIYFQMVEYAYAER